MPEDEQKLLAKIDDRTLLLVTRQATIDERTKNTLEHIEKIEQHLDKQNDKLNKQETKIETTKNCADLNRKWLVYLSLGVVSIAATIATIVLRHIGLG